MIPYWWITNSSLRSLSARSFVSSRRSPLEELTLREDSSQSVYKHPSYWRFKICSLNARSLTYDFHCVSMYVYTVFGPWGSLHSPSRRTRTYLTRSYRQLALCSLRSLSARSVTGILLWMSKYVCAKFGPWDSLRSPDRWGQTNAHTKLQSCLIIQMTQKTVRHTVIAVTLTFDPHKIRTKYSTILYCYKYC